MATRWTTLGRDLFLYRDSCNVYLLRDGERAIAIDLGVAAVDHVVLSHAHRDQLCGLYRGGRGDFAVHAPAGDRDLLMPCARADFWRHYQHNGCPSSCGDAVHAGGAVQQSYHLEWDMDYDYRALHFEPFVNRARPGARLQLKRVSRNRSAATRALEAAIAAPEDWRIDVPPPPQDKTSAQRARPDTCSAHHPAMRPPADTSSPATAPSTASSWPRPVSR